MEGNNDNDGPKHVSHFLSQALDAIFLRAHARSDAPRRETEETPAGEISRKTPRLNLVRTNHQEDETQ